MDIDPSNLKKPETVAESIEREVNGEVKSKMLTQLRTDIPSMLFISAIVAGAITYFSGGSFWSNFPFALIGAIIGTIISNFGLWPWRRWNKND